jgi:putative endopeptidase
MKRTALLVLACGAMAVGQQAPRSGIDKSDMDLTCKPCQDFWRYANGGWLDKNPIPPQYSSWGAFTVLAEQNRQKLHNILEAAARNTTAPANSNERKIGDFYASCMDTGAIDARGAQPIQKDLDRIAAISSVKDLTAALTEFQRLGSIGPFSIGAGADAKNSKDIIVNIGAGGISLPDRDYYTKQDARSKSIRDEFVKHVAKMFELLGDAPDKAAAKAPRVLAFETTFAEAMMTNVQRRDPYARYHKMDLAALNALAPNYDFKPLFVQFKIAASTPINVSEPEFIKKFNEQLTAVPLDDWKLWLRWRVVDAAANSLSKPFVDADFHFSGAVLQGTKEQQPRWQTCVARVDRAMGEALGQAFVKEYFPPEAKRRMNQLVANLRLELGNALENADWMSAETKKNARAKLDAFVAKIGYPDKWRDYSALKIDRKSYFDNVRAAALFARLDNFDRIGKPVDRTRWGMTPPTVNAYYSPQMNEIAFPAGILQPPFFDMTADDAVNYGAIGAVIGHEMGHGFDDQGSKFDAEGNLRNWWTREDRAQFEQRAQCVIDEFDKTDLGGGLHHNGKLVIGEGLGDLNGVTLALRAYHRSLGGKPAPVIDGFTGDQRFFIAFARIWATQFTPEALRLQLNTNPHPVAKYRSNVTLRNIPEFQEAFHCASGDPMVKPPEDRCKLW